jgi:hypothetical protein
MNYKFNEKEHIHTLDGKPLMGVTSVLQVISKPFLIQWSANMACDYVRNNLKKIEDLEKVLLEAKTAHRKKKEKAGDWGTNVHKAIELWIKENKKPELDDIGMKVFNKFEDWVKENKVEFLESEKNIWSKELWIGGILDLVIKMNGKKYIGDIKTSSGIYNEAFFQMGAYNLCLEEMNEHKDIDGYLVINLKKDGNMDMKMATDMDMNKDAFKFALGLYKIINSLK